MDANFSNVLKRKKKKEIIRELKTKRKKAPNEEQKGKKKKLGYRKTVGHSEN